MKRLAVVVLAALALSSCSQTSGLVRDSCTVAGEICNYVDLLCDSTALYGLGMTPPDFSRLDSLVAELKACKGK